MATPTHTDSVATQLLNSVATPLQPQGSLLSYFVAALRGYFAVATPWLLRGYSVAAPRLLLGWLLRGYSVATPCLLRSCRSGNCRSYSVATPLLRLLTDLLRGYPVATPCLLRGYSANSVATRLLGYSAATLCGYSPLLLRVSPRSRREMSPRRRARGMGTIF